ncbi:MAG: hypothetical protein JO358_21965 [Alphaproteobacteria bacterium]|nr:hypothetical protein [Alphaproteobacteria bacterium]
MPRLTVPMSRSRPRHSAPQPVCPQCLQRRQPRFDETLDFYLVTGVTVTAGVGSSRNLDTGRHCPPQALHVVLHEIVRSLANVR